MSVPRHTVQGPPDLDTTAELPVLDVVAYEAAQEQAEPYKGRLEEDLKALSASLRELEERLAAQGKRSSGLESDLESLRGAHAAAEQRASGLSREVVEAREALSAAEAQIRELMQLLEERELALRSVERRDGALTRGMAQGEQALARAELELREARLQASAQLEALQSREARRGVLDALFRELDGKASRHESALAAKDEQLASLARANEELRQSVRALTESGAASLERLKAAELDVQVRSETHSRELAAAAARQREIEAAQEERLRELEASQDARRRELEGAQEERRRELEVQVADYAKAAVELQQELAESHEQLRGTEDDVRAAEDTILRLEGELRAKVTRIEELTQLNDDWRDTLEAARQSIAERDALIRRLEAEAAHSTALVDNLQQSMCSLEASPGSAEEAAAQSATRLLIRAEGESEVVHVLGRKTSIGRTPDNDVQIDTKFVSRHHAVILAGPAHTIIEDLNSTNGLLVNGQRVMRQNLKDGDAIVVGNAQFRFAMRPSAAERRPV